MCAKNWTFRLTDAIRAISGFCQRVRWKGERRMSEVCRRGYKCMCFQCGEKDCERYESEPPEWIEKLCENESFWEKLEKAITERNVTR